MPVGPCTACREWNCAIARRADLHSCVSRVFSALSFFNKKGSKLLKTKSSVAISAQAILLKLISSHMGATSFLAGLVPLSASLLFHWGSSPVVPSGNQPCLPCPDKVCETETSPGATEDETIAADSDTRFWIGHGLGAACGGAIGIYTARRGVRPPLPPGGRAVTVHRDATARGSVPARIGRTT